MERSETAAAREWVTGLVPATWFWSRDVPVRPEIARPVLSRLQSDQRVGLWGVARGLYWRGYPEGHTYHGFPPDYRTGALMFAGAGAGLCGWSALNALGWTLQCPAKSFVSVVGRAPRPIHPTVVYRSSGNPRREGLSWTEVTVLEALGWLRYSEEPWHMCLESLSRGDSFARTGWDAAIRPAMLRWAAAAEKGATVETLHRVDEIADALPHAVVGVSETTETSTVTAAAVA